MGRSEYDKMSLTQRPQGDRKGKIIDDKITRTEREGGVGNPQPNA
jgi:hypothetical protein